MYAQAKTQNKEVRVYRFRVTWTRGHINLSRCSEVGFDANCNLFRLLDEHWAAILPCPGNAWGAKTAHAPRKCVRGRSRCVRACVCPWFHPRAQEASTGYRRRRACAESRARPSQHRNLEHGHAFQCHSRRVATIRPRARVSTLSTLALTGQNHRESCVPEIGLLPTILSYEHMWTE
jgi:hypothetical protein